MSRSDGPDRERLGDAYLVLPEQEPGGVVVLSPAMGVPAAYYALFARELARHGLAVAVRELRGQGENRPLATRRTRFGYQELVAEDLARTVETVRGRFPEPLPLYLFGHSLGGHLSMLYLARDHGRTQVDGLVLVASGTSYWRAFPLWYGLGVYCYAHGVTAVAALWGHWPGDRLLFGGRQPAALMRDWARLVRDGRFRPRGADVDYEALLAEVRVPTRAYTVAGDLSYTPRRTVDLLTAKLSAVSPERRHWRPSDGSRPGHLRWPRSAGELAREVADWTADLRLLGSDTATGVLGQGQVPAGSPITGGASAPAADEVTRRPGKGRVQDEPAAGG